MGPDETQVLRERDQYRKALYGGEETGLCTRTVSTSIWVGGAKDAVGSRAGAPRRPASIGGPLRRVPAPPPSGFQAEPPDRPSPRRSARFSMRIFRPFAQGRGGCLLRRPAEQGVGRGSSAASSARPLRASSGRSNFSTTTSRSGSTGDPGAGAPGRAAQSQGTQPASGFTPTHGRRRLDAGRMGVSLVRGVGLGLSSGSRSVVLDPGGRQAATDPARVNPGTCIRTGSCPRTNGNSATSIRPCRPGRRCAFHNRRRRTGQGRPQGFSERVSHQAAAQLHLVGEPQGPARTERLRRRLPRHGQHRRLRPVRFRCRSTACRCSPTARRGWRCTA